MMFWFWLELEVAPIRWLSFTPLGAVLPTARTGSCGGGTGGLRIAPAMLVVKEDAWLAFF